MVWNSTVSPVHSVIVPTIMESWRRPNLKNLAAWDEKRFPVQAVSQRLPGSWSGSFSADSPFEPGATQECEEVRDRLHGRGWS